MYSGSFLAFSYVLADSPAQIQQVYNAAFQQNVHHDAGKWHEAKMKNPDSQFAYPSPVYGFNALSERSKQQKSHLNNLVAAADNAKTQISNLKSHTERVILTELNNCERRNQQLSMQLTKLMLSIEMFGLQNCKASVDYGKHRELLEKVEKVSSVIAILQKKISELRGHQKQIESLGYASTWALPVALEPTAPAGFITLKDSVAKKSQAVYNAVIDRCRAVSAQAMHERLSSRSKDHLAELKRGYICAVDSVKFRTMQSFELAITRMLSGALTKDVMATVLEIAELTQAPQSLMDLWHVVAHVCNGPQTNGTRACIEFLESKFAKEIGGVTHDRISNQMDKKSIVYTYCRQRISVRTGDHSWIWFAVYCALRAGWSAVLAEIALEKAGCVDGLDLVCGILAKIIEGGPATAAERDTTKLNSILLLQAGERATDETTAYRRLLVMICKNEFESIRIAQDLPDCNSFDWIWFGLRSVVAYAHPEEKLQELRKKIDALPPNHFDVERHSSPAGQGQLYPLLSESFGLQGKPGVKSTASAKAAVQLGLMHFLTLDFEKGIRAALKTREEIFDMNDPFHRCALFISVCSDKFGLGQLVGDASHIVLEAALTVAVVQERNTYASAVSGATGKKILDQLARLDHRRDKSTVGPASPTGAYPTLKGR